MWIRRWRFEREVSRWVVGVSLCVSGAISASINVPGSVSVSGLRS